jgi:hypothetical protein
MSMRISDQGDTREISQVYLTDNGEHIALLLRRTAQIVHLGIARLRDDLPRALRRKRDCSRPHAPHGSILTGIPASARKRAVRRR